MTSHLSVLIGDFSGSERAAGELISEWASANILRSVARLDVGVEPWIDLPRVTYVDGTLLRDEGLFDLLTSKRWQHVTVIALREANLASMSSQRFQRELQMLDAIRAAFADSADTTFRSCTSSIIETTGVVSEAFDPMWGVHLAQEPVVRIDPSVASQPMREGHRASLISLLGLMVGGGFTWQRGPLLDNCVDETRGDHKPIRLARAFLRVVNAGRLTDNVLGGAFPVSGPWSVPGDMLNARAVPPNTWAPDFLVTELAQQGSFTMRPLQSKHKPKSTNMGMRDGIRLFFKEFASALKGIPRSMVATVRGEVQNWVQRTTFGADSSISLKFDPLAPDASQDEYTDLMQSLNSEEAMDAIGESLPWELLQRVALGLVDGGKFPDNFKIPTSGVHRLVYTDPAAIGPSPTYENFTLTSFERALLSLGREEISISPVDVLASDSLQTRLKEARESVVSGGFGFTEPLASSEDAPNGGVQTPAPVIPSTKQKSDKRRLRRKSAAVVRPATPASPIPTKAEGIESISDAAEEDPNKPVSAAPLEEESDERHRPSHPDFNPTEYVVVTSFYQGQREDLKIEFARVNDAYAQAMQQHKPINGFWSKRRACDHCGTRFDYGVLYLHHPTGRLVHVGNVCARKAYGLLDSADYFQTQIDNLETRWKAWLAPQSKSLLWRVGVQILNGLNTAQRDLQAAVELLSKRPKAQEAQTEASRKFGRWTRRGGLVFLLLMAASIASIFLTPLPLLLFALLMAVYATGFLTRLVFLARDLVRMQYKLARIEDEYERAYERGRHSAKEIIRLLSVADQFADWQAIIREVVHVPFGRNLNFDSAKLSVGDITRPPSFVLATAKPEDLQQMRPFLNARSQTIHTGWLTEIMDVLGAEWKVGYQNSRILSPGDNIFPESDNASSESVVGRHPLTNENVYYPRSDFRRRLVGGRLQEKLVAQKSEMIADDLRRTPIETLLGKVEINGPGSALTGMAVKEFLSSLATPLEEAVPYMADLISDLAPQLRNSVPEMILPKHDELVEQVGHVQVEPGVEFTAATWIVELSDPIGPMSSFRGYVRPEIPENPISSDDTWS
jgi:hypothetical protein